MVVIFQKEINIKKDSLTEFFLIFYVRNEYYKKVILQAILNKKIIIFYIFNDSTITYKDFPRNIDYELIFKLNFCL